MKVPSKGLEKKFVFLSEIGSGRLGKVYKVKNIATDEILALKICQMEDVLLNQKKRSEKAINTLLNEFKILSHLDHPNIVKAKDMGFTQDGYPYFLMEYVNGSSIREFFPKLRKDKNLLMKVIRQLCDALDFIHCQGIIHADMKPDNILVEVSGSKMTVKVSDFGLAEIFRISQQEEAGAPSLKGTYHYMSPEIISGRKIDHRSDLYSVGIILYEIVTGKNPFDFESVQAIVSAHLNKHPVPPISINTDLDPAMNEIILQLLAKEPSFRPSSAQEIAVHLQLSKGEEINPPPVTSGIFVGQHLPWKELQSALELTCQGKGAIVLVSGEKGIGKSRFLDEVKVDFELSGTRIIESEYSQSQSSSYDVFRSIFNEIHKYYPKISADFADMLFKIAQDDQINIAADPKSAKFAFSQLAHLFLSLMKSPDGDLAEAPLVIILKEFHTDEVFPWMFFKELASRWEEISPEGLSCLWLIESRSEYGRNIFSSSLPPRFQPVELVPLNEEETGILLGSLLSVTPFPLDLTKKIHDISRGIPLIVHQLAQAIHQNKAIHWKDYSWRINEEILSTIEITSELNRISKFQLQTLSGSARTILNHISLWPRPIVLEEIMVTLPEDVHFPENIQKLILNGFVSKRFDDDGIRYLIHHPSLQEMIHEAIPAYERVNLHLKIADFLMRTPQSVKSDIAYHLLAGDNRIDGCEYAADAAREFAASNKHKLASSWFQTAIDKMPDRNRSKLAQLNYELAQSKFALFEFSDVITLLDDADAILESRFYQKREKAQFLLLKGNTLLKLLKPSKALPIFEEIMSYLPKTTGMDLRLKVLSSYGYALVSTKQAKKAVELIQENLSNLPMQEYAYYAGLLLSTLAWAHILLKNLDEAEIAQKRSIEYGEMTGNPVSIIDRYITLGKIYQNQGRIREAMHEYEKVISLARKASDPDNLSFALTLCGQLKLNQERESVVEKYFIEAREIGEKSGNQESIVFALETHGSFYIQLGKIERGKELLTKALTYDQNGIDQRITIRIYQNLSDIEYLQGNWSMALKYSEKALQISRQIRDLVFIEHVYYVMAMIFQEMRNWRKALLYLNRSKRIRKHLKLFKSSVPVLECEIYFGMDDVKTSLAKCKELLADPKTKSFPGELGQVHRLLGRIYHKQGYFDKAKTHFFAALKEHEMNRIPFDTGLTHLYLGELYQSNSELEKSKNSLLQSQEIFKRFGASHYLELVEKALELIDKPKKSEIADLDPILTAFEQITGLINSITDIQELLEKILDSAIRYVNAERGLVILYNDESKDLDIKAIRNLDAATSEDARLISRTVLAETAQSDTSILSGDAPSDPRFSTVKSVKAYNILSLICSPMRIQRKPIGALYVDSRRTANLFSDKDRRFLQTFADLAAITIERSQLYQRQMEENSFLQKQIEEKYRFDNLIGKSRVMQELFQQLSSISRTDTAVLITGRSGTGKELAARAIHYNSHRRNNKFVAVNCAAIPDTLLESELFGYVKGAFTDARQDRPGRFEFAEGGTLFLDEIAELPVNVQAKLLRAIETKEITRLGEDKPRAVDVRIVAATNKDLRAEIQAGNFREDIYYRLRVAHLRMPELKDHIEDLPMLAEHFLIQACKRTNRHFTEFDPKALEALTAYAWPGNVRELENAVESAVVFGTPPSIHLKDLPQEIRIPFAKSGAAFGKPELRSLDEVEEAHIRSILAYTGGNKLRACQILDISRPTLDRKLDEYNISAKKFKHEM